MTKKKIIMLVDDNPEFLKEFQEMLELSGYKTSGFLSGEAALASLKKVKPDLILLDLKMNGKSGFDVVCELQSDLKTKDIPIIVVSAFVSDKSMVRLLEEFKLKRCIQKPVKPLDIISQIEFVFAEINEKTEMKIKKWRK